MSSRAFLLLSACFVLLLPFWLCAEQSLAAGNGTVTSGKELEQVAITQFTAFGNAMGVAPEELANPQIRRQGTVLYAQTDRWVYCIDVRGNQTFRPRSTSSRLTLAGV